MTDNAYVFAHEATPAAVDALKAQVGGVLRVVCPLTHGDRRLYVAVADQNIATGIGTVEATDGVTAVEPYFVLPPPVGPGGANPTYCAVGAWIGFGVFDGAVAPPSHPIVVAHAPLRVEASGERFLVEVTADDESTVGSALAAIAATPGLTKVLTAWGPTDGGAGLSLRS